MRDIRTQEEFFNSPHACWKTNNTNKKEFIIKRKCHKIKYHEEKDGCLLFDNLMEKLTTPEYRESMMLYYVINPVEGQPRVPGYCLSRLAGTTVGTKRQQTDEISLLAKYAVAKLEEGLILGPLPRPFASWPRIFVPDDLAKTYRQKELLLKSIDNCIRRRIEFRNKCVIPCSKRIRKQGAHDEFVVVLQILRARLIIQLASRHRIR